MSFSTWTGEMPSVTTMTTTSLGALAVSLIAMGMTALHTGAVSGHSEPIPVSHRALDMRGTHVDAAEAYGPFTNEGLVGRAAKIQRDGLVSTSPSRWEPLR